MTSFYGGIGITNGSGGGSGISITNIEFDSKRNLIIYLSDGSKKNLGQIDGAIFKPTIENGILSWSNDKGLENPPSYDLKADIQLPEEEGELWVPIDEKTEEEQPESTEQEYMWEKI